VRGCREQLGQAARLHQPAGVHHRHPVGQPGHHAEVVGDEDDRRPRALLHAAKDVQHLGLDRHVEGGGRFVGDQHVGVVGHGHGDDDPLLHAP
jgi:hypothetical protein